MTDVLAATDETMIAPTLAPTEALVADLAVASGEEITYSQSAGLIDRLARMGVSLAFTSYQSGCLYMLGASATHGPQLHISGVQKPMGLSIDAQGDLTLCAGVSVIRYQNVLRPGQQINHIFDACYTPRTIHTTGDLDGHDVGVDNRGRIIFVSSRFNCLATISDRHSFEPVWLPPFISTLIDEDRCHLNGLAMEDGEPAYVTAVSRSDTVDGWRDRRDGGGVVVDVRTGEIVCDGLSMPHSPRMHNGELWVLNAGAGELVVVVRDGPGKGRFEPRVFCPGFLRGLALRDGFAFVGLSKPRYKRFGGLPLDERLAKTDSSPWCGVQVIDLATGGGVDWFRIDGPVAELYDLAVIPGFTCPMAISPGSPEAAALITHADRLES